MKLFLTVSLLLAVVVPTVAQDHSGHSAGPGNGAATAAFEAANMAMHDDMMIEYTGNADVDFLKSMIPHHQGAIDMAKIVLQHGSDPEVKAMAEEIIEAQEAEIAAMQDMLAKLDQ